MTQSIIDVHTPTSSFSIMHSLQQDNLTLLYDRLSRKANNTAHGERIGPGWLKYEWNGSIWNLDDDADYAIFVWRQTQALPPIGSPIASGVSGSTSPPPPVNDSPATATLHMHSPNVPLPNSPEYYNPSYYAYRAPPQTQTHLHPNSNRKPRSIRSSKSKKSSRSRADDDVNDGVPQFKKDFYRFHSENGVRTIMGSIGPVSDVRMLLKNGYRHVYISRAFAKRHNFIPPDATPGYYGYSGLISIGQWPLTVGSTTTTHAVYLSEETHFDVILGRSFQEKRNVKTDASDLTMVICGDTGEKVDCEVVIIRDGKGEFVTVT